MHPLAHAWARDRPGPQDQIRVWITVGVILAFASGFTYDILVQLRLHVVSYMQEYPKTVWKTYPPMEIARTIYRLCSLLLYDSDYTLALNKFNSIQEHLKPVKGSLNWMRLQDRIAVCLNRLDQNQQELLLRKELEVFYDTIASQELRWQLKLNLANCYRINEQYEKAQTLLKKIIRERRAKQCDTGEEFSGTLHYLAMVYEDLGKHRKALKLRDVIVDKETAILHRTHPNLLSSRHNLGLSYLNYGMPIKAIEILKDVVEIQVEIFRPTHEGLLGSQDVLAQAYAECGVYDKAIELMETVVTIRKHTLKPTHQNRIGSENWLGQFYLETNSFSKAVEFLKEVVQIREQVLDSSHFALLVSKEELGRAYLSNHKYTDAVIILEQVRGVYLKENYDIRQTCWYLSIAYWRASRKEDTLKLLRALLADKEEPINPIRRDFERLLERCQDDSDEPLDSAFEKKRDWMLPKKIPRRETEELSECSSISSYEESSGDEDSNDMPEDAAEQISESQPRIIEIEDSPNAFESVPKTRWWRKRQMDGKTVEGYPTTSRQDSGRGSKGDIHGKRKDNPFKSFFYKSRRE